MNSIAKNSKDMEKNPCEFCELKSLPLRINELFQK